MATTTTITGYGERAALGPATVLQTGERIGTNTVPARAVQYAATEDWRGLLALARRASKLRLSAQRTDVDADGTVTVRVGYGSACLATISGVPGFPGLGGYRCLEAMADGEDV